MKKFLILAFLLSGIVARASDTKILLGMVPERGSNDIILVVSATFTNQSEFKTLGIKQNDRFQAIETSGTRSWSPGKGQFIAAYIIRPKMKGAKISHADFTGLPDDVIFTRDLISEKYREEPQT
ncbi:MAG: hypothetical protein K0R17_819 [Rariglobus sp.]|jgi:hypothetical protein|nr:hypothetical protein [Rariglobus sp.]